MQLRTLRKTSFLALATILAATCGGAVIHARQPSSGPRETQHSFKAANNLNLSVKMLAPYGAPTDLQIICLFKHNPAGDKYVASMQEMDEKLGGLLSALRNGG